MHRHTKSRRGVVLAAALVATVAPLSIAHAAPTDSALSGVVLLDGHPVTGAVVTLTLLPGLDAPAGPYRQQPQASAITGPSGGFSLSLQVVDQVLRQAAENAGWVNYTVQAFYNDTVSPATSDPELAVLELGGTTYSAGDFVSTTLDDTGATDPADSLAGAVLATPDPVTLELTAVGEAAGAPTTVTGIAGTSPGSVSAEQVGGALRDNGSECRSMYAPYVTTIGHDDNFDPIGEAHVAYDTTGKFTYGETANTDLGGAYSYKGGKWDISVGTNHMGNTKTEVIADYTAHQAYVGTTKFRYRKERLDFTDDWGDGHVCRTDYRIVPEGWLGGWLDGADVSSKDSGGQMDTARGKGWALKFRAKTHWTKDTSRGHKYHTDVSAFGVGLHATSTWSSDVQFHWDFGGATDEHWLYGSNGTIKDAENVYAW